MVKHSDKTRTNNNKHFVETFGRHAANKNSNGHERESFEVNNNKHSKPEDQDATHRQPANNKNKGRQVHPR